MEDDLIRINILGVNLTLKSDDSATKLKQVIWLLNKKIEETRERHKVSDQLKLSILTGIYLAEEVINLKNANYRGEILDNCDNSTIELEEQAEQIYNRIIESLDSINLS